jgi:hypothetical protein
MDKHDEPWSLNEKLRGDGLKLMAKSCLHVGLGQKNQELK